MEKNARIEIITKNRIGITEDILRVLHASNIDLISMEVHSQRICMMVEPLASLVKKELFQSVLCIPDVLAINEIELLDFEKTERSLLAMIYAVDEGILAVDKHNRIQLFNSYCEKLFNKDQESVLGIDVRHILGETSEITQLIHTGEEYNNRECRLDLPTGTISYVSTGRLIKDDDGEIVGAVASIKDINKVIELMHVLSGAEEDAFREIIGGSDALEQAKKIARSVSRSNSTVMIRGKSGTGKELFAKAIHILSGRKGNFVTINCAAIPEQLLESELFGYEKGSFTGAVTSKHGLFEEANHGTLFLDEIGELSLAIQAKLLRVLQEGVVRHIGGHQEKKIDVRVVVATHRDLEKMKQEGHFREDLYYRLNVIPIYIPSLKRRKEDIPLLVNHFIARMGRRLDKSVVGFNPEFMSQLMAYEWPGNVRELQNVIERAMILCEGNLLTKRDLYLNEKRDFEFKEGSNQTICLAPLCLTVPYAEAMDAFEKKIIEEAIHASKSYRKAAQLLQVSHTTVMNKVKRYHIKIE